MFPSSFGNGTSFNMATAYLVDEVLQSNLAKQDTSCPHGTADETSCLTCVISMLNAKAAMPSMRRTSSDTPKVSTGATVKAPQPHFVLGGLRIKKPLYRLKIGRQPITRP